MNVIDKILNEWSFRCHDGIVDINDPIKLSILNEVLEEYNFNNITNPLTKEAIQYISNKYGFDDNDFNIISNNSFKVLVPPNFYKSREDIIKNLLENPNFIFEETSQSTIGRLKYKEKIIIYIKPVKNIAGEHIETAQINYINDFINKNKGDKKGIDIMIGDILYKNIYEIKKIEKNKQADFILIGENKNAFIQHKDNISQQYSGIHDLIDNDEVKSFITDVKNKLDLENQTELKNKESYKRKIKSDDLKKLAVYGRGENFGENKVQAVFFNNLELKPNESNEYFSLVSSTYFIYNETPTEEYEPYLAVTYRKGRNQQNIKNARFGFYPEKYVKNFKEISNEEQPLSNNKYIKVPSESRLGKTYVDKEWFNAQSSDIKQQFDTSKPPLPQDGKEWIPLSSNSDKKLRENLIKELTNCLVELLDPKGHFKQRINERGNVLDILNLNEIPLKDYNTVEVKEKLKSDISNEIRNRATKILEKESIPLSNLKEIGIKVLKPILISNGKEYSLKLFAKSITIAKDGSEIEKDNIGTLYFATVYDNKATTLLLLNKEDDSELYFQIKKHAERKPGRENKEAEIITPPNYIYRIDLDELMGKEKQGSKLIDPSTLPYELRTDYRTKEKFEHKKFGTGTIVDTSSGTGGKGDSRGIVSWIDVKYKPYLKGGKLTDIRRFENIYTLVSPLLAK